MNLGSQALALPLPLFGGHWAIDKTKPQYRLSAWANYLRQLQLNETLMLKMDLDAFENDISKGLCFLSDVPQGYGAGSSGVLCAALYDRYRTEEKRTLVEYKNGFAQLESFFHGRSSGIDPLVCYLNQPLLIINHDMVTTVTTPMYIGEENAMFLLDTHLERDASVLIQWFLKQAENEDFKQKCQTELVYQNNLAINAFLEGHWPNLMKATAQISQFQYEHLNPLIPIVFQDIWAECLKDEHTKLKICGAGGGGFILGITKKKSEVAQLLKGYNIRFFF